MQSLDSLNWREIARMPFAAVSAAPRWLRVIAALALVLITGSMGRTLQAQAAPAATATETFMEAEKESPKKVVCVGSTVTIHVWVKRRTIDTSSGKPNSASTFLPGVIINGKVANPSIGTLDNPVKTTKVSDGSYGLSIVTYIFTARKAGTTQIDFEGLLNIESGEFGRDTLNAKTSVKVSNCKVSVDVVSQSYIALSGDNTIGLTAIISGAEMTADEDGNFTGSATVTWAADILIVGCAHEDSIPSSQAEMTGQMNEDGQLVASVTYQSATLSESHCGPSGGTNSTITPQPLNITVASSGGSLRQSQSVEGPVTLPGSAMIVVVPTDDGAAAADPTHQTAVARAFSMWEIVLWNNFGWLAGL